MTAKDLINYMIPHLRPEDTLEKARIWMADFKTNELPVAEDGEFLGLLDESDTAEYAADCLVNEVPLKTVNCAVSHDAHYYSVLSVAYNLGVRMVSVLDKDNKYLGVVSVLDVVEAFAQSSAVNAEGAILVLKLDKKEYSLSSLAAIIESNDVKILSSHLSGHPTDPEFLRLTLKLDAEDVQQIKSVFGQREINVEASFNTFDFSFDQQERLDMLMKYLAP